MNTASDNILFCSDFSDDANFAFSHAVYHCRKNQARLHVMHVALSPESYSGPVLKTVETDGLPLEEPLYIRKVTDQILLALRSQYEPHLEGITDCAFAVRFGSPDVEIIRYARENAINMIVMGVVGRAGLERGRGRLLRTAANVSKYSDCQVVTIGRSKR